MSDDAVQEKTFRWAKTYSLRSAMPSLTRRVSVKNSKFHLELGLVQKTVGTLVREAGKKHEKRLLRFLEAHAGTMPRPILRYAVEKVAPRCERSMHETDAVLLQLFHLANDKGLNYCDVRRRPGPPR